ncbi:tetratricopeptide repeat protein [Mucilaginibacter lacusdianchii]|uniref:type IX secretion system periplasmic lipoprotein PorW/SprE n=1 Tax=Mucilaginibacter lacusdianchii TaxID=2684211 RepID=UPI00131AB23E|nr:gliding motility protein [Mucilaginibacter sp. JXJ CY 39]
MNYFLKSAKLQSLVLLLLLAGCSLEKKSAVNRGLQNLTAKYNILFNADELLQQKQDSYAASFIDAYDQILPVYQDTASHIANTSDKELDAVVAKANNIISIKEQSHYIGDAYLLLGKAAHLNANYYNAVEFFNYVTRSYHSEHDLVQEARAWQVRSLLYLNQLPLAKSILDSALLDINPKSNQADDVYAAGLQYHINTRQYTEAEEMATQAIAHSSNKQQRLRWTFILAQLQELNRKPVDAYDSYTRVVKSNAPFVLAFNADLNRIRLEDNRNGAQLSRTDRLKRLLRNQNNEDFTDQIYYQLAELALSDNHLDEAIKNYKLSVKYSQKNQTQKGLSYLRLADISFKNQGDYVTAKLYYDSTLLNLPPNYPGYQTIRRKADNLQLLADRLQIISREDTLQALAKLDEPTRARRVQEITSRQMIQQTVAAPVSNPFTNADNTVAQGGPADNNSFYFYNTSAVSQGFTDFKRRWGNRKLEDNWRRSDRYNSDIAVNAVNSTQGVDPSIVPGTLQKSTADVAASGYRQDLLQNIPLTPQQLAQSNTRIYNAYVDIANFYRDILDDKPEAIRIYELLISRFPDDPNLVANYYNLYRLYSGINQAKSDEYKNLILSKFGNTTFAKVINDPDYAQRLNDRDAELNAFYNQIYDLYTHREYPQVIARADELLVQYPDTKLSPQIAYLRTLASGHQEKVQPFRSELVQITSRYPDDRLITPLIQQHLAYIDANQAEMASRPVALVDTDPDAIAFIPAPVMQQNVAVTRPTVKQQQPATQPAVKPTVPTAPPVTVPKVMPPVTQPVTPPVSTAPVAKAAPKPAPEPPSIFNKRDSSRYYFVINVTSGSTNLSSSRFGVGQFNRTNYQGVQVSHQLKPVGDDNQLIYVGRFSSLDDVKNYARGIVPLLPQIMKVSADKYSFFIITQENLDKLADRKLLDSYTDYYQKNY